MGWTNQTTYEQIKGAFSETPNPYDRGLQGNCMDLLCRKVRPSFLRTPQEELGCGTVSWRKVSKQAQSEKYDFDPVVPPQPRGGCASDLSGYLDDEEVGTYLGQTPSSTVAHAGDNIHGDAFLVHEAAKLSDR